MRHLQPETWAIVLAGGDGTRLAHLTEALHRRPTPKQFAAITGGDSMLQATLRRTAVLAPPERTVIVVGRHHLPWVRQQVDPGRGFRLLVQPAGRGTAVAILAALHWISLLDRDADVIVFPSDHHVSSDVRFCEAVAGAQQASRDTGLLTLVGVVPDGPDADYGWIVPGTELERTFATGQRLDHFVEKPGIELAADLFARGALWNTFIMTGAARTFWRHAERHLPVQTALLERLDLFSFAPGSVELEDTYHQLPAADFSGDVLQRASDLAVVPMVEAGWSDWGTPDRVLTTLSGTPYEDVVRRSLREQSGDRTAA
jgi:mannose-1-phosphate guanylyltransferase